MPIAELREMQPIIRSVFCTNKVSSVCKTILVCPLYFLVVSYSPPGAGTLRGQCHENDWIALKVGNKDKTRCKYAQDQNKWECGYETIHFIPSKNDIYYNSFILKLKTHPNKAGLYWLVWPIHWVLKQRARKKSCQKLKRNTMVYTCVLCPCTSYLRIQEKGNFFVLETLPLQWVQKIRQLAAGGRQHHVLLRLLHQQLLLRLQAAQARQVYAYGWCSAVIAGRRG